MSLGHKDLLHFRQGYLADSLNGVLIPSAIGRAGTVLRFKEQSRFHCLSFSS